MKKMNRKQLEQNKRKLQREKEEKEFIAQLNLLIDTLGGEGTFALLPPILIECIYPLRVLPIKVITQFVPELDLKSVNNLHHLVADLLHRKDYAVDINGVQFPLDMFMSVGFSMIMLVEFCRKTDKQEPWMPEFTSRFSSDLEKELHQKAYLQCKTIALAISLNLYDFSKDMFWFHFEITHPHEGTKHLQHMMYVHIEKFEVRTFRTAEGIRTALRISWAQVQTGLMHAEINPMLLGMETEADQPVAVYIQRHAIRRLEERLDCLKKYEKQYAIFESMVNPLIVRMNKNKILIACRVLDVKMGYFAAEYLEGVLLIHTFLFITNNGTPEGKKLNELTGLSQLDKKYLTIDKLSSFMNSDISHNNQLKTLFTQAGCSSLLDISKTIIKLEKKEDEQAISDMILKYLEKGENAII
jgi:hypothetical protein